MSSLKNVGRVIYDGTRWWLHTFGLLMLLVIVSMTVFGNLFGVDSGWAFLGTVVVSTFGFHFAVPRMQFIVSDIVAGPKERLKAARAVCDVLIIIPIIWMAFQICKSR